MRIENSFTVATPADELWAHLLDVERIAPCLPGAELTEALDDRHWKGRVNVKFGPVAMAFAGTVEMTERDDEAHRVVLAARGTEQRGKGAANATVTSWLEAGAGGATDVHMTADITLTGAAAQLSRGLLPEISRKLTQQFADCLQARMASGPSGAAGPSGATDPSGAAGPSGASGGTAAARPGTRAEPVNGLGLGLRALWSSIVGFVRRLFGGGTSAS